MSYVTAQPNVVTASGLNFPGLFAAPYTSATAAGDSSGVYASAVADFDKKNGTDVITVNFDGALNLLANDGTGRLSLTCSNSSAVTFSPYVVYVAVADLNGDGYPDVIAQDDYNSAFLVFLNNGDGTFANATSVSVSPASGAKLGNGGSFVVGDVNGDGIPDVVTVSSLQVWNGSSFTTTFSQQTFLGNGNGTFQVPATSTDASFPSFLYVQFGQGLALADLNGDHRPDLVTEYYNAFGNWVFVTGSLGNGDGSFAPIAPGASVRGRQTTESNLEVTDLNGDGRQDAIYIFGDGNLYVALGNGDGTFQSPTAVLQNLPAAQLIRLGDFNGDGYLDVLVYGNSSAAVYAGYGDGTFNPAPAGQYGTGSGAGDQQPLPADFDGDGNLDFADVDSVYGTVSIYKGWGDGSFAAQRAVAPSNLSASLPNSAESADNYIVIATGDINGDGKTDVLAYDATNLYWTSFGAYPDVNVGLSDGKGGFNFSTIMKGRDLALAQAWEVAPLMADFNHDGHFDLLVPTENGLSIALGQPDGSMGPLNAISLPQATGPCSFGNFDVGDINNDGNLDILGSYSGGSPNCVGTDTPSGYFVLLGNGKGGFNASFVQYGEYVWQAKLVDLDGDGKLDLVVDDGYQGSGSILICANCQTPITALRGNGDGTFDVVGAHPVLNSWRIAGIVLGDYDVDGKQDLALLSAGQIGTDGAIVPHTHGIALLKGNGDFTFQDPVMIAPDSAAANAQYADLNGDGLPDLVFSMADYTFPDYFSQSVHTYFGLVVLPNLGGGTFDQPINLIEPQSDPVAFVGDFNGDGAPDVLIAPPDGLYLSPAVVYLNAGATTLALTATPSTAQQGSPVVLRATLSVLAGTAPATGNVTFYANGKSVGTIQVNNSVIAELTTSGLPVGTDTITATYSGDSNHNPATATSVSVTVQALPAAFTMTPSSQALALHPGQSGTVTLNFTANLTFNGQITVACSGLPPGASCAFNPASLTLTGAQTGSINTVIATSSQIAQNRAYRPGWVAMFINFAFLPGVILARPLRRKRSPRSLGRWMLPLLWLVLMLTLAGCGGSNSPKKTTAPSSESALVKITATGNSGGAVVQQTAIVSVTITN